MFGKNEIIVKHSVKFECPKGGFFGDDLLSALFPYKDKIFFVWTDHEYRPFVTMVDECGAFETVPVDANPDYKAYPDGHHRFSIGVDKNGYIHVAGDMHNHTAWNNPNYIERYRNTHMMYWVSKESASLEKGFDFHGKEREIPGCGWTYGRFFADNKGTLYYAARVKAIEGAHAPGEIAFGLYSYDADGKKWTAIGGMPDRLREGPYTKYYPVLFWENGGFKGDKPESSWYQGLLNKINFDHNDRLHVAAGINSDVSKSGNNALLYAYTDDYGKSWKKANGELIAGLPLRAVKHPNQADVVAMADVDPMFDSKVSAAVDPAGVVAVVAGGYNPPWYFYLDGKWQKDVLDVRANGVPGANSALNADDGTSVMTVTPIGVLLHSRSFKKLSYGYEPKGYSELYSATPPKKGELWVVGRDEVTKAEKLLKITAIDAPLPDGMISVDIQKPGYAGVAGYKDGKLVVTNFGKGIQDKGEHCHFVHYQVTGDALIEAKVSQVNISGHARAGVMIRESLEPGCRMVFVGSLPEKPKPVAMIARGKADDWAGTPAEVEKAAQWLRLERKGDEFTGSYSMDGKTWEVFGSTKLALGANVLIGFAGASYHPYGMQEATFEDIKIVSKEQPKPEPPSEEPKPPTTPPTPPKEKSVVVTEKSFDEFVALVKKEFFK